MTAQTREEIEAEYRAVLFQARDAEERYVAGRKAYEVACQRLDLARRTRERRLAELEKV